MNEPQAPKAPPYWYSIVEFDRLVDQCQSVLMQKREQELKRRSTQSPHAFLRLQAGESP